MEWEGYLACCGGKGMSLKGNMDLAGVAQWIGCQPVNQRVAGSIPSQGTCLGCEPGPQLVCERQLIDVSFTHQCFSLPLSPYPPKNT